MPRRLLGILIILLVPTIGWAQGETVLLQEFEEKVVLAEKKGLDTLPEFKMQLDFYYRNLLHKGRNKDEKTVSQRNEWIKLASITQRLPQQVTQEEYTLAMLRMDSVYNELKKGADFDKVAQRYALEGGEKQTWTSMPFLLQEWRTCLSTLEKNEISQPFLSPLGIHIIYWTDKKYWNEEVNGEDLIAINEDAKRIRDYLLVAVLEKKYRKPLAYTEKDLEDYFKQHRNDYAWVLPHYRGAVVHCRDKKEAKRIKKLLKKRHFSEWEKMLSGQNNAIMDSSYIEIGLFPIGKNKYVDKLVFGCGDFEPVEGLPYTFVIGKKLKKGPDSYMDVQEKVLKDYLNIHYNDWLNDLR